MSNTFTRLRLIAERGAGLALAVVLLRSAAVHAGNPYYFLSSVYSYQIIGTEAGVYAAATLPAVQIALAVCLFFRWWARGAYVASAVLFAGFTVVQASALNRGLDISCGCFGAADSLPVSSGTLALAATCSTVAVVGFLLSRTSAYRGSDLCVASNENEPVLA